jgi:hypothetical protein
MKRTSVSILHVLLMAVTCLASVALNGQEPTSSTVPNAATALAVRSLRTIEKSTPFPSTEGRPNAFIFVGESRNPPTGWRVIVVEGAVTPRVRWDSFTLHDSYLNVTAPTFINSEANGRDGYIVTLRGCVPHQCGDGRIGFALYASESRRTFVAHVSTQDDNSYRVTYSPKSGIPEAVREKLDQMMCSDSGISKPSALPIKCSAK